MRVECVSFELQYTVIRSAVLSFLIIIPSFFVCYSTQVKDTLGRIPSRLRHTSMSRVYCSVRQRPKTTMKTLKGTIVAVTFLILGLYHRDRCHHCQPFSVPWVHVYGFKNNPVIVRRVPYRNQHHQEWDMYQHAFGFSDKIEPSKNLGIILARARARSTLFMAAEGDEQSSSTNSSTSINFQLVLRNLANQALIGSQIWTGGDGLKLLSQEAHFGPSAILFGIAGLIPMLQLSRAIETSESPLVAGLNLSTNMAVLRLFGPTKKPISAFLVSLLLATSTGIVEETVFRGQGKCIWFQKGRFLL